MSTENVSLASSLGAHPSVASRLHHRDDSHGRVTRLVTPRRLPMAGSPVVAQPTARSDGDDVLPIDDFMRQLHREKRRAERSKSPLSLAVYRTDQRNARGTSNIDELLEVLHAAKRETDILGHIGDDALAVLCPDTSEDGMKGFNRKIDSQARSLSYSAVAATYPDHLFESLDSGIRDNLELHALLATDSPAAGRPDYPLKRCLDIVGALVALCLFAPIMAVVAAIIAMTSPGPIVFRQVRLGKGGVPFVVYKFRSMVTNGDDGIHRAFVANLIKGDNDANGIAQEGTPTYKIRSDPRVTRIGRFIRKTSIDEFPQFFNVLKGEMSLVGPRPPIAYEAASYQPWHLRRILAAKPGITGLWQVEGRSKVSFNDMVRLDLRYIRGSSLGLDIRILLKTVLVVLRCDGAN